MEGPSVVFYGNLPPDPISFKAESSLFDPSQYGKPADLELTSVTRFDREFRMVLGNRLGFYNGKMNYLWTINREVYPHSPTLFVKEGEKIKTTFINKSLSEHPMHLHGHQMTVLKKNGKRVQTPGSINTNVVIRQEGGWKIAAFQNSRIQSMPGINQAGLPVPPVMGPTKEMQ
jgi:FtsP/CotA-like multicopper oxidase with cupredoxin domain